MKHTLIAVLLAALTFSLSAQETLLPGDETGEDKNKDKVQEVTLNGETVNVQGLVNATIQEPLTVSTGRKTLPLNELCHAFDITNVSTATDNPKTKIQGLPCTHITQVELSIVSIPDTSAELEISVRDSSDHHIKYFLAFLWTDFSERSKSHTIQFDVPIDVISVIDSPEIVVDATAYPAVPGGGAYATFTTIVRGYEEQP